MFRRLIPFVVRRNVRPRNLPYAISCFRIAPKGKKLMTFRWAMKL